jgi:hypothetical protein
MDWPGIRGDQAAEDRLFSAAGFNHDQMQELIPYAEAIRPSLKSDFDNFGKAACDAAMDMWGPNGIRAHILKAR